MTEKRFNFDGIDIEDNVEMIEYALNMKEGRQLVCDLLNAQHEEITQLKFQLQNTCDQRDEFYRGARENANRVGKLEKENEQLKQQLHAILKLTKKIEDCTHDMKLIGDGE